MARAFSRKLTPRQVEVVRAVADGLCDKKIAERLGIARNTVAAHLHTIYDRMDVNNRTELVMVAVRAGYLSPNDPPYNIVPLRALRAAQ